MATLRRGSFSPVITSLANPTIKAHKPTNSLLQPYSFRHICNTRAFFTPARPRVSQTKALSPKRFFPPPPVLGLVDRNSGTHPEGEPSDSDKGSAIDTKLPGRSLLVQFTCNQCGERTQRLINRLADERGLVYAQGVSSTTN